MRKIRGLGWAKDKEFLSLMSEALLGFLLATSAHSIFSMGFVRVNSV
jgi:hypothetical protein